MKNTKLKSVLQIIFIMSLLASMLCMSGCKKEPPKPTVTTPTTLAPTETTAPVEDTKPTTPTTPVKPTDPTTPNTDETIPSDCEHILGDWIVDKASTCTTEGSRYKECSLCKGKAEVEVIPITTHLISDWIVDQPATCTSLGQQHLECTQCTEKMIYITVGMADHKTTTITGYTPTDITPGRTDRVICKICDATVQESYVIPMVDSIPYIYRLNSDGKTCTITGVLNFTDNELILPTTVYGYPVTAIGENAFANRTSITTVYIPKSVTQIGAGAFNGCQNLTSITYPDTAAQWNLLPKGAAWNADTGNYTLYCTNASLAK